MASWSKNLTALPAGGRSAVPLNGASEPDGDAGLGAPPRDRAVGDVGDAAENAERARGRLLPRDGGDELAPDGDRAVRVDDGFLALAERDRGVRRGPAAGRLGGEARRERGRDGDGGAQRRIDRTPSANGPAVRAAEATASATSAPGTERKRAPADASHPPPSPA